MKDKESFYILSLTFSFYQMLCIYLSSTLLLYLWLHFEQNPCRQNMMSVYVCQFPSFYVRFLNPLRWAWKFWKFVVLWTLIIICTFLVSSLRVLINFIIYIFFEAGRGDPEVKFKKRFARTYSIIHRYVYWILSLFSAIINIPIQYNNVFENKPLESC